MSTNTRSQTEQSTTVKQSTPAPESALSSAEGQLDPVGAFQRVSGAAALNPGDVLMLQRTIGNRAVQGLLAQRNPTPAAGAAPAATTTATTAAPTKEEFIKQYKTWLEARLVEVNALAGDEKVNRARAFLAQIERVSVQLSGDTVPSLEGLSTTPTFEDNTTHGYVPHELIGVSRKFIVITEQVVTGATEATTGQVTEGSRFESNTDWNSRLGVPQYRTQSDNLAAPEATCNVTSFAMVAERLGYSRENALQAIDKMLKEDYLKTPEGKKELETKKAEEISVPETYWQERAKKYLETVNNDSENYRKIRGNKLISVDEALVKAKKSAAEKEKERKRQVDEQITALASDFKGNAQTEDLLDFMTHLMGIARTTITSDTTNAASLADKLNGDATETHKVEQIYKGSKTLKEIKKSIGECLSKGGAAVLSFRHKGAGQTGTHIVAIQSVTDTGIVVDDPYGKINDAYRSNKSQDAYAATGKTGASSRSSTYKNQMDNATDGDWKASTAQTLTSGEALGNSYEISDDITKDALNYVTLWFRAAAKT